MKIIMPVIGCLVLLGSAVASSYLQIRTNRDDWDKLARDSWICGAIGGVLCMGISMWPWGW